MKTDISLIKTIQGQDFISALTNTYKFSQEQIDKTTGEIAFELKKLPDMSKYNDSNTTYTGYCEDSIKDLFIASSLSGLSLSSVEKGAYIIPFKNKKTKKVELQFMPSYFGLLQIASEKGYKIKCDYIIKAEERKAIDPKQATMSDFSRFTMGLPNIPNIDFLSKDVNKLMQEYKWNNADIIGFYAYAIDTQTGEVAQTCELGIAEVMERCMESKGDKWDATKNKWASFKRVYKNEILQKHLENIDGARRTDAIEILKIRVIRQICKLVPKLRFIAEAMDRGEGYSEERIKDITPNNDVKIPNPNLEGDIDDLLGKKPQSQEPQQQEKPKQEEVKTQGKSMVCVKVDVSDKETQERVKANGLKWNPNHKSWCIETTDPESAKNRLVSAGVEENQITTNLF
jgi:hypothetical protein